MLRPERFGSLRGVMVNPTVAKKPEPAKKPEFERSIERLEEIVRRLEGANLSLDEAMNHFGGGVQLSTSFWHSFAWLTPSSKSF